jgi:hypothetical protein
MQYIEAQIPVFFFKEGDKVVAYSPAFDLSTYGNDEKEAKRRFSETVSIFLKECAKMGTLDEVLEECGWRKEPNWSHSSLGSCTAESIRIPMPA